MESGSKGPTASHANHNESNGGYEMCVNMLNSIVR